MRFIKLIVLLFLSGCASVSENFTFEDRVDRLFSQSDGKNEPGYAIGIIRNGDLIFARGYGLANIEKKQPITSDTVFNIASLSKQFTAASIAKEIESGTILLDDKLSKHWPDLPQFMGEIRIAHLIYMTSGLKEYYTLPSPKGGWASEDRFTVEDAIGAVLSSGELEFEPGSRWSYSNTNYQFLSQLVSRLHGTGFADYMDKIVFGPLGMESTWVDAPIQSDRQGRATNYIKTDAGIWQIAPRMSPHYGGSGMFSTIEDLAKWDAALYRDRAFGDAFTQRMLSTKSFDHDKDNDAFGLVHGSYKGLKTIWYEGGDYGASAYMVRLPKRDETVICLSNFGSDRGHCREKAEAVLDIVLRLDQ